MTDNDSKNPVVIAIRESMASVSLDIRDMRNSQASIQLQFQALAINVATVLEKVSAMEKQIVKVEQMEDRMHDLEIRFSLVENQSSRISDIEKRIKNLEDTKTRVVAIGSIILLLIQIGLELGKMFI